MSKEVRFEKRPKARVQIVLIERGYRNRITSRRQFTVSEFDLRWALRNADLLEKREVKVPATPVEESAILANEIAWYNAQLDRTGGTPSASAIRDTLWKRINEKLGLS